MSTINVHIVGDDVAFSDGLLPAPLLGGDGGVVLCAFVLWC